MLIKGLINRIQYASCFGDANDSVINDLINLDHKEGVSFTFALLESVGEVL